MKNTKLLSAFGWVAVLEGISFLILIVASFMKRGFLGDVETGAMLVKNVGMAHGVLFVLYVLLALQCKTHYSWTNKKMVIYLILSLVPFGTFWVDKEIRVEKKRLQSAS